MVDRLQGENIMMAENCGEKLLPLWHAGGREKQKELSRTKEVRGQIQSWKSYLHDPFPSTKPYLPSAHYLPIIVNSSRD